MLEYTYWNGIFFLKPLFRFVPRHADELYLEIDDPLLMLDQSEDLWCHGYNMRTGVTGIFPAFYTVKVAKETNQGVWSWENTMSSTSYMIHRILNIFHSDLIFSLSPGSGLDRTVLGSVPGLSSSPHPQREWCTLCCNAEGRYSTQIYALHRRTTVIHF